MNKVRFIATMLMASFMLSGCQGLFGEKEPERPLTVSEQKTELLERIEKKFTDADAHYELGKMYRVDGLLAKSESEFNLALNFDPMNRDVQAAMVKTLIIAGNEAKSKQLAEIYMDQVAGVAEDSLLLGRAFQMESLDDYALACYQQALAVAPNSAALHKQIGYYYLAKKDQVRAEEYLRRSFQLDPYQPTLAGQLGKMGIIVKVPQGQQASPSKLDKLLRFDFSSDEKKK